MLGVPYVILKLIKDMYRFFPSKFFLHVIYFHRWELHIHVNTSTCILHVDYCTILKISLVLYHSASLDRFVPHHERCSLRNLSRVTDWSFTGLHGMTNVKDNSIAGEGCNIYISLLRAYTALMIHNVYCAWWLLFCGLARRTITPPHTHTHTTLPTLSRMLVRILT